MTEQAVAVALIVFYAVLIIICLWMLWQIYNEIMDIIKDMISNAYEEGIFDGKKEEKEKSSSGTTQGRTEFQGSYGIDAEEEERK